MKTAAKMTTKEAVRRIQRYMAKHFSRLVEVPKLTQFWAVIAKLPIDPSSLGPFGPAIETMEVEVKAAVHPVTGEPGIILEYRYAHVHGGTNGYRVTIENV